VERENMRHDVSDDRLVGLVDHFEVLPAVDELSRKARRVKKDHDRGDGMQFSGDREHWKFAGGTERGDEVGNTAAQTCILVGVSLVHFLDAELTD
jgi:hypothetical protein